MSERNEMSLSGSHRIALNSSTEKAEPSVPIDRSWATSSVTVDNMHEGHAHKEGAGVWLSWTDLTVDVDVPAGFLKKEKKRIVQGSRGRARPGELLAVMGPSGAGKSTLFNALALRGQGYDVNGQLLLNGMPYEKTDLKKVSGFVFQDSLMHSQLKVHETLRTAAELKLPRTMSRADKKKRVDTLMDAFDLHRCADTKVVGCSGGEKKRLSIAIEVLPGPSLLFLDEPTTGLDAASSLMVLQLLRELADAGTNVILVLHQPRANVLKFINNFLVLSDGEKVSYGVFLFVNKMSAFEKGRDVFYGSLKSMLAFFESVEMPIPLRVNPVDHVLDIINTNETLSDLVNDGKNANKSFAQIMRGDLNQDNFSELRKESAGLGLEGGLPGSMATMTRKELALHLSDLYRQSGIFETICAADPAVVPPLSLARQPGSSFGTRFVALLKREFTQKLRNPEVFVTQIAGAIVLSLVMGSIFYQMPPTATFNITSGISFGALMNMFLCFHLILLFPNERKIWLRDRDNGLYGATEYYLSVVLSGFPGDLIATTVLGTILYWMFGLKPDAGAFFIWIGFFMLLISVASALLLMGGALSPSTSVANSLVSVILLFVMVFNGFFIGLYPLLVVVLFLKLKNVIFLKWYYDTIPVWFKWIAEVNFMRFGLNALYFTQFSNQTYNCTVGTNCFFQTGDAVLTNLGISTSLEIWRMAVYILIIWFIFHCLALLFVCFCYTSLFHELSEGFKERKKLRQMAKADQEKEKSKELIPL